MLRNADYIYEVVEKIRSSTMNGEKETFINHLCRGIFKAAVEGKDHTTVIIKKNVLNNEENNLYYAVEYMHYLGYEAYVIGYDNLGNAGVNVHWQYEETSESESMWRADNIRIIMAFCKKMIQRLKEEPEHKKTNEDYIFYYVLKFAAKNYNYKPEKKYDALLRITEYANLDRSLPEEEMKKLNQNIDLQFKLMEKGYFISRGREFDEE